MPTVDYSRVIRWTDTVERALQVQPDFPSTSTPISPLTPLAILAQIAKESSGDPFARSDKGALGLMQLMPYTARDMQIACPRDGYSWADVQILRDLHLDPLRLAEDPRVPPVLCPFTNISGGIRYMRRLMLQIRTHRRWGGGPEETWRMALAAYNAGLGTVIAVLDRRPGLTSAVSALDALDQYADAVQGKPRNQQDQTVRDYIRQILAHREALQSQIEHGNGGR